MNKKIIIIVAVLVALSIASTPAKADIFDWLGSKSVDTNSNERGWSFDKIYSSLQSKATESSVSISQNNSVVAQASQVATKKKIKSTPKTFLVTASAYSSSIDQTDSTPFITASNTFVRDGIIAANFLPMGTRIKIPQLFGDKQFIVEDRMNSRYWYNIDLWFADRDSAIKFGRRQVVIEIVS
jgi:3D (Asp-Asp-Asp) domain-containing protein